MSSGSSALEVDADAETAGVEGFVTASENMFSEVDGTGVAVELVHVMDARDATISAVLEATMTTSPGLPQEHNIASSTVDMSTDTETFIGHKTSAMAAVLVNVQQEGSVSSEFHVNDAVMHGQRVIEEALPADGTEDFRVKGSIPDSALEGLGSGYDTDAQDVPMTHTFLDDNDFIFQAINAENKVNSWQGSDDASTEGNNLGCNAEQQATLGTQWAKEEANTNMVVDNVAVQNVACDEAEMGAQDPSNTCDEVPNHDPRDVVKQPVIDADHNILHVSTFKDAPATQLSCETKEHSLDHGIRWPQRVSLRASHDGYHAIYMCTTENASTHQVDRDKDPGHPVLVVENTNNYTKTPSNAETIQACIETAMVKSQLGIPQEADVDNAAEPERKQESLDAVVSCTHLGLDKKGIGAILVTKEKHHVASGTNAGSDSLLSKIASIVESSSISVTAVPAGAACKEALLDDIEPATEFSMAKEKGVFRQDDSVPSSARVHTSPSDEVGSATHEKLLLMSEKSGKENREGCEVIDNEEELVVVALEQGKDQSNEQAEEPAKEHHEVDHECSVQEGMEGMRVEEPINGPVEVPTNKHSKPADKCSAPSVTPSISFSEVATSSKVMAESVNPCKEVDKVEEQKKEEKMPGDVVVHGYENLASQIGKMEGETILEDGSGRESPTLQGMVLVEASKVRSSDSDDDEETQPERHENHKVLEETSVRQVEGAVTKAKQSGGKRVEGNGGKDSSLEYAREKLSSKKIKKAHKVATVFGIGDMVWAKVRSHPWWPAQIFDPVDASKAARKLKKPGRALVAFFGDGTFAWLEQAQMIAFRPNFEEKVKQTTMRSFCMAVEEALEEACRRFELGLRCEHCNGPLHSRNMFPDANTGIREGVRLESHRDMSTSLDMFRPNKMLEFVNGVACSPLGFWSSTLSLWELRGHAYGVRTCMVALRRGDGTSLAKTAVAAVWKAKRTFSSLKTDEEPVVERASKQSKRPKIGKGRLFVGEGGSSDTIEDGRATLLVLSGNKALNTSSKKEGRSSHKVRRHRIGALKNAISTSATDKDGHVRGGDSEPATPTRTESRAEDAFVSSPRSDGEDLGSTGTKKLSDILRMGPQPDARKTSKTVNDAPVKKDNHEMARKETSKKFIKVGDSIKKVAGQLTRIPPSKHVDEPSAKSSKPGPKKQKHDFASQLQCSLSKGGKAGTMDAGERDSPRKAGGGLKGEKPQRKGNQEAKARAPPHWQNVPHKSQKSGVQELAPAARKRKSELLHEEVVSKVPKVTIYLGRQHASKVVTKSQKEKPSTRSEKISSHHSERQDMKGSSERLDEKLSSHIPLGLFMRFPEDFPLPSESQLEATFIPFGPLQVSATRLYRESSSAQVVFKHGRDAESAMKHAKKNALFGPVTVTYRLRHLLHSVRTEAKTDAASSGKSSIASARKPSSMTEKTGLRLSFQEENAQDVGGASKAITINSDNTAEMPTSDIQDKMMTLLQQVSVIVNPSPVPSDGT